MPDANSKPLGVRFADRFIPSEYEIVRRLDDEMDIPTSLTEALKAYGVDEYHRVSDGYDECPENYSAYWHKWEAFEDNVYEKVFEDMPGLMTGVDEGKHIYKITQTLRSVPHDSGCTMPILPNADREDGDMFVAKMGRGWKVLEYGLDSLGNYTGLENGDEIVIDSRLPLIGAITYKVEITEYPGRYLTKEFNPYGKVRWKREHLIQLPIKLLKKQFGPVDAEGKEIESNKIGWFDFTTRRMPQYKEPLVEEIEKPSVLRAAQ